MLLTNTRRLSDSNNNINNDVQNVLKYAKQNPYTKLTMPVQLIANLPASFSIRIWNSI